MAVVLNGRTWSLTPRADGKLYTADDPATAFPVQQQYEAIMTFLGETAVPSSNTRYWEGRPSVPSGGTVYASISTLNSGISTAAPGSVLKLQDGSYSGEIIIDGRTDLIVCAQTVAGVTLTGTGNKVNMDNSAGCDVLGFSFDTTSGTQIDIDDCDDCRVALCDFQGSMFQAIQIRRSTSFRNRLCYNFFSTKTSDGANIKLFHADTALTGPNTRIDHNYFTDHRGTGGASEHVAMGQWAAAQSAYVLVDSNYIESSASQFGSESEAVSIKTGEVMIINNVFDNCNGTTCSLREAHRNFVVGNWFFNTAGNPQGPTITAYGGSHYIWGNYGSDLDGGEFWPLVGLWKGAVSAPADRNNYPTAAPSQVAADDAMVAFNTAYNCDHGFSNAAGGQAVAPDSTEWYNNCANQVVDAFDLGEASNVIHAGDVFQGESGTGITNALPEWATYNGGTYTYRIPAAAGNLVGTGVGASGNWESAIMQWDILGNGISTTSPFVGAIHATSMNGDPVNDIKQEAGVLP